LVGLYDSHGVLRYAGRDQADCLAYAEFFGLEPAAFCLEPLAVRVLELSESAGAPAQPL
jgi:hypothetical protein